MYNAGKASDFIAVELVEGRIQGPTSQNFLRP
jgi:hypothetical protein